MAPASAAQPPVECTIVDTDREPSIGDIKMLQEALLQIPGQGLTGLVWCVLYNLPSYFLTGIYNASDLS